MIFILVCAFTTLLRCVDRIDTSQIYTIDTPLRWAVNGHMSYEETRYIIRLKHTFLYGYEGDQVFCHCKITIGFRMRVLDVLIIKDHGYPTVKTFVVKPNHCYGNNDKESFRIDLPDDITDKSEIVLGFYFENMYSIFLPTWVYSSKTRLFTKKVDYHDHCYCISETANN